MILGNTRRKQRGRGIVSGNHAPGESNRGERNRGKIVINDCHGAALNYATTFPRNVWREKPLVRNKSRSERFLMRGTHLVAVWKQAELMTDTVFASVHTLRRYSSVRTARDFLAALSLSS